jgi:carbamoyl-phosphate synthase small subunit
MPDSRPAILALEDGMVFPGRAFGATTTTVGEACFNTSMTGYQEVLTDPSYRGQIVAMTYPLIGNYGVNALDNESASPHVRGFVVAELCRTHSSWRADQSLDAYLVSHQIPGIERLDTRSLTRHLRSRGALKACLCTDGSLSPEAAVERAASSQPMAGSDFVHEVTTSQPYHWDPDGTLSGRWQIPNPSSRPDELPSHNLQDPLPPIRRHIVAYDFGIKYNMLRRLRQHGFAIEVVPAHTPAQEVLARKPDGVFLSNGPGDPAALTHIHTEIRQIAEQVPLFAICLGHQILGHAFGGKTFKLKFGHRGGNQPVQDLRSGKVAITSQNHGFAIDADSLPDDLEVTHINLNDRTVEGLRHRHLPAFSVQYHPEAAPGPNDAELFFSEFANLIDHSLASR